MWNCCCVKAACWSDAPLPRTDINSPMIKARADVVSSARAFPVWGEICLSKSGLWDTQDAKIGLYKRKASIRPSRRQRRNHYGKHKSSKQSSSYCPIVSDLIDLGAALALDVFSALLRQRESASKHSYRVDPYAAAGIAAGMGRLNTLDEIMQMGGQLGSLGAFDAPTRQTSVLPFHCGLRGNCYAWRLSCEDGSAYGIDPANYETRGEYDAALFQATQQ